MTENEAGSMSHSMCIFGRTVWMPMDGAMPMGDMPDYSCPDNGMEDQSPDDCTGYMDASCD